MSSLDDLWTAPYWWGALRVNDSDDTRAKTWANALVDPSIGLNDRIQSITAVVITRRDQVAMGANDLICFDKAIDLTGLITTLKFRKGLAGVTYLITIQILSVAGTTLFRDAYIKVVPTLG